MGCCMFTNLIVQMQRISIPKNFRVHQDGAKAGAQKISANLEKFFGVKTLVQISKPKKLCFDIFCRTKIASGLKISGDITEPPGRKF